MHKVRDRRLEVNAARLVFLDSHGSITRAERPSKLLDCWSRPAFRPWFADSLYTAKPSTGRADGCRNWDCGNCGKTVGGSRTRAITRTLAATADDLYYRTRGFSSVRTGGRQTRRRRCRCSGDVLTRNCKISLLAPGDEVMFQQWLQYNM